MTPIFGIALAMLRGDTRLFWKAVSTEVLGVVIAIGIAFILAILPLAIEATPEMLARTKPNLLDLMVAVFAGFAGTFAIIDERVSPALPGVAIATAIVPPLSNTGLCLALGAYSGAIGSFTLFAANFFAILLIGAATFAAAGMLRKTVKIKQRDLARNFLFAAAGFVLVSVLLTHSLITMVKERRNTRIVSNVIINGLAQLDLPPFTLLKIDHNQVEGNFQVIATVLTSEVLSPKHVSTLKDSLTDALHQPTELVVRTLPAHDIAAAGSDAMVAKPNLDGRLISSELSHREKQERIAEQFLYEQLTGRLGLEIEAVNYGTISNQPNILVTLRADVPFSVEEIRQLRQGLQDRLELSDLGFAIESVDTSLFDEYGRYLIEWTNYDTTTDFELLPKLKAIVRQEVAQVTNLFPVDVHVNEEKGTWRALAEIVGPQVPKPDQVTTIQQAVAKRFPLPVEVVVWFKNDVVVTANGYAAFKEFTKSTLEKRIESIPDIFRK